MNILNGGLVASNVLKSVFVRFVACAAHTAVTRRLPRCPPEYLARFAACIQAYEDRRSPQKQHKLVPFCLSRVAICSENENIRVQEQLEVSVIENTKVFVKRIDF